MVQSNDFQRQWEEISGDMRTAFERVGSSGYYILGPEVARFEGELAKLWGLPHAVGVANGMDAIEISLRAAGIGPGDRVLTTPLTAFATTLAILRVGAMPVFCDVDPNGLMDLALARKILEQGPRIRACVPVHLYGHCLDLDRLRDLKREFNLIVVEDCAQSIGAEWNDVPCGSVGDFAATSFYPTKNLGCMGDGGAVLTADSNGAGLAIGLRNYGQRQRYEHVILGLNSRLDELQAAFLHDAVLPRLPRWTERRREIARAYLKGIRNERVRLSSVPLASGSVWHLFPVFVREPALRSSLETHLKSQGIQSGRHYPILVQDQSAYREAVAIPEVAENTPMAVQIALSEVSLPVHPHLGDDEIERVVEAVNSWTP